MKKYMNRHIGGAALSAFLCLTGALQGQLQPACGQASRTLTPLSPEEQAKYTLQYKLEKEAAVALDAGEYATAEADAKQAVSLEPDSGMGQEVLAEALDAQGKNQEALQAYQEMASQGYNPPRVWLPYALLLLKAGQWAQAVSAYDKALPNVSDGDLVRVNSHFSSTTPEPTALATAIHIALGLTEIDVADWGGGSQNDKAMAHFQKAFTLSPNSDLANYYYGYGLQKLGRTDQAAAAFQKTLKMAKGGVKTAAEQALKKNKKPV